MKLTTNRKELIESMTYPSTCERDENMRLLVTDKKAEALKNINFLEVDAFLCDVKDVAAYVKKKLEENL